VSTKGKKGNFFDKKRGEFLSDQNNENAGIKIR